jgi:hypothetical protein
MRRDPPQCARGVPSKSPARRHHGHRTQTQVGLGVLEAVAGVADVARFNASGKAERAKTNSRASSAVPLQLV